MAELRLTVAGTSPGTPPLNQVSLFASSGDKRLYVKDDTGAEVKVMTNEAVVDGVTGTLPILVSAGATPNISIQAVTPATNGAMIAADKLKLDSATSLATPNELVIRNGLGDVFFNEVTATLFNGTATSVTTVPALIGDVTTTGATNATTITAGSIDDAKISATANIALTKLATNPLDRTNHTGTQPASTISDFGTAVDTHLTSTSPIVNAMIDNSANIALSKLATDPLARANHTGTQTSATISDFTAQVNLDVAAYITANPITDSEVDASANIALSKLATDPLARANHTGTQLAATISDFNAQVPGALTAGDGIDATPLSSGTIEVLGTAGRIDVSSGNVDIDATYVGQNTITTLGTVTLGTWNGTLIDVFYGGTNATTRGGARNNLLAVDSYNMSGSLDAAKNVAVVDATTAIVTLALPAATVRSQFTIKKIDNSANDVIITADGSDTIDGSATYPLSGQWSYVTIVSDLAANWYIVAEG